jgi:hypothetical protein
MTIPWLQEAVELSGLEAPTSYPRDIASLVPMHLPLGIVYLAGLSTCLIHEWLHKRGITYHTTDPMRRLRGALVARAGEGLIFINSDDPHDEQRFTIAHETAHFVKDHVMPRAYAIRTVGPSIAPVLNGERPPTPEEAISAVLNCVPLGLSLHLMTRGSGGRIVAWQVEESEQRADRLALEFLAPFDAVLQLLKINREHESSPLPDKASEIIATHFGLPKSVATSYASLVLARTQRRPKLSEILLGGVHE